MSDLVLIQAQQLNFPCVQDDQGKWQVSSPRPQDMWQLHQAEERWILTLKGVPQIRLSTSEAIKFLLNQAHSL